MHNAGICVSGGEIFPDVCDKWGIGSIKHDETTVPAGTVFQRHSALTDEKKR